MNTKGLVRFIVIGIVLLLVISVGGYFLFRPRSQITVVGTVDIPVGDDMTTPIAEGMTRSPYGEEVPVSIMKGMYVTDFSAVVKVMSVEDTRTIRGEITSPTSIVGQDPEHVVVILYLCEPLSNKADKLSDGTIVYKGDGYPQIVLGNQYEMVGVLQHGWQDWPFVYVPIASQIKQTSFGN